MEGDWKLIQYHEDQRVELYNVVEDIGEQTDLSASQRERAESMETRLQAWLKSTGAKFPVPDPQYDAAKRDARWESLRTAGKQRLEKQHARYLDQNYRPNADWWESGLAEE